MSRVLTLTSDFGSADGYVGAMKGRILRLAPSALIMDISHEIEPQDVLQGAWCLRRAIRHFPPGSIHLAVVDPGVGTERRGLVVRTERFLLVGPDNGLLMWAAENDQILSVWEIEPGSGPWRRNATFEGLSLFAEVAGYLLAGGEPGLVGPPAERWTRLDQTSAAAAENGIKGEVILHDRFGNAITNITQADAAARPLARIEAGGRAAQLCLRYHDLAKRPGVLGALWNSDGHLELFAFLGSVRDSRLLDRGSRVFAYYA